MFIVHEFYIVTDMTKNKRRKNPNKQQQQKTNKTKYFLTMKAFMGRLTRSKGLFLLFAPATDCDEAPKPEVVLQSGGLALRPGEQLDTPPKLVSFE